MSNIITAWFNSNKGIKVEKSIFEPILTIVRVLNPSKYPFKPS